jgi:hypothetical protein
VAGEGLSQPAQVHAGENQLRAGRADVDADTRQRDVVLDPDRVVFERAAGIEIVVIVVVVDAGGVGVSERLAAGMVLQGVRRIHGGDRVIDPPRRRLLIMFLHMERLSCIQNTLTRRCPTVNVTGHNCRRRRETPTGGHGYVPRSAQV